jgi:hypothetical protein
MQSLRTHLLLIILAALASLTACKAIEIKPEQIIRVSAIDELGQALTGLRCTLNNDKGQWSLELPGEAEVLRSSQPLHIECPDIEGGAAVQGHVDAIDERKQRAKKSAMRYGAAGAVLALLFAGGPLAPAAIIYMAVLGAATGGAGAAGRGVTDTLTDSGYVYPELIELRPHSG